MITVYINDTLNEITSLIKGVKEEFKQIKVIASGIGKKKYKTLVDKYIVENEFLSNSSYVDECLYICRVHKVKYFIVHRKMTAISARVDEFRKIGTKLICSNKDTLEILYGNREAFFKKIELLGSDSSFNYNVVIPYYSKVWKKDDFVRQCVDLEHDIAILSQVSDNDVASPSKIMHVIQQVEYENIFEMGSNCKSLSDVQSMVSLMPYEMFSELVIIRDISHNEIVINGVASNKEVRSVCYDKESDSLLESKFFRELAERICRRLCIAGAFHIHLREDVGTKKNLIKSIRVIDVHGGFSREIGILCNEYGINLLRDILIGECHEEDICNRA